MNEEQQLIIEVARGDRLAMRRLYDQYAGYAMAVGLRYVPNEEELKDILQDCFIKIYASIKDFEYRREGALRSWIARIVANESLEYLRRSKHMVFTDSVPDVADDSPDMEGLPDEVLTRLIGQLPEGYRAVLNMFVFSQMSHKEIARQLGISPSTSASQYHHAKRMLAKMINDYQKRHEYGTAERLD